MSDRIWTPAELEKLADGFVDSGLLVHARVVDALRSAASRLRLLEDSLEGVLQRELELRRAKETIEKRWGMALQHIADDYTREDEMRHMARAALGRQP